MNARGFRPAKVVCGTAAIISRAASSTAAVPLARCNRPFIKATRRYADKITKLPDLSRFYKTDTRGNVIELLGGGEARLINVCVYRARPRGQRRVLSRAAMTCDLIVRCEL